ncbi:thioesterase II family protein [Staphylococcus sp. CH99b_3]|uniref:thioesterase II family protein n=1 Tax=Staphylococcus sp. CH99b_3 TaxID=2651838 RepID=UPI00124EF6B0|nr:thioesterase domain-containing protein [Staphylococcus sp. CH99b_3]KAB2478822.1 thioesterase [Staphylococcus sp. CH99b_3]
MVKTTLFCIPFAGGNKSLYYPLKDKLPSDIILKPLELPGRGERLVEEPLEEIEDMVDDLVKQIMQERPEKFIILGYSLGTILAYEIYFKLSEIGYTAPQHMILCACEPIGYTERNNNIEHMNDLEFKRFIQNKGGTPEEVLNHEELWDLVKPSLKNDFLAIDNYHNSQHEDKVETTLSVFVGENDDIATDTVYKWSELTEAAVDYKFFHGDHFFINNSYDQLSEEIKALIN